jgi:hypothetical protein
MQAGAAPETLLGGALVLIFLMIIGFSLYT